jgi:hypothetical protein
MKEKLEAILLIIGLYFLSAMVLAIPTLFLWNLLLPDIFGFKYITLPQAMGINFLTEILFKARVNIKRETINN